MKRPCVIIDDEKLAREKIILYLNRTEAWSLKGSYATAESFLADWPKAENLLIFLDIELPNLNGLELASMIKQGNQVIFTTAYAEYALEGFELDAVDYLLKPFNYQRFLRATTKAQNLFPNKNFLLIKSGKKIYRLLPSDIFYIEAYDNYAFLFDQNGKKHLCNYSLLHLEKKLSTNFLRVHRKYLINKNQIAQIKPHLKGRFVIEFKDKKKTSITSSTSYTEVIKALVKL